MRAGDTTLDDLDRQILQELEQDGRRPFREIGRSLGLSEATIRARVRRLRDSGMLRIVAFVDPFRAGYAVLALVFLRVEPQAYESVVDTLVSWPEVSYTSTVMGRADVFIQVVCADTDELWELVTKRIRALPGVLDTETVQEVRVHKFAYSYPHGQP